VIISGGKYGIHVGEKTMRQSLTPIVLAAALVLAVSHAHAADDVDCANAVTTVDLNTCAEQSLDVADKALNETYKKILADLALPDTENAAGNLKWADALKVSQRAWVAFRDADCAKLMVHEAGGGTATTGAILGCMTELTQARTKSLQERYEDK
jgi:uncharacterized protein YecT (DUF1311 family)